MAPKEGADPSELPGKVVMETWFFFPCEYSEESLSEEVREVGEVGEVGILLDGLEECPCPLPDLR
jgi:hypothetical protein